MRERHSPIFTFHFNQYQDVICVSFYCSLKMAPEEGQNVCKTRITITLAVIFMMKKLLSYSQNTRGKGKLITITLAKNFFN